MTEIIKPGMVVYVRTTDEPCFVLALNQKAPDGLGRQKHFSGTTVQVRRPLVTDNGLQYVEDSFLIEELSASDRAERLYKEMVSTRGEAEAATKGTILGSSN